MQQTAAHVHGRGRGHVHDRGYVHGRGNDCANGRDRGHAIAHESGHESDQVCCARFGCSGCACGCAQGCDYHWGVRECAQGKRPRLVREHIQTLDGDGP